MTFEQAIQAKATIKELRFIQGEVEFAICIVPTLRRDYAKYKKTLNFTEDIDDKKAQTHSSNNDYSLGFIGWFGLDIIGGYLNSDGTMRM